jgi:uncharacterized SAM-binding protein YcdF (DUF218 family)
MKRFRFFEGFRGWVYWSLLLLVGGWVLSWLAAEALIVRSELQPADALVVLAGSSTYRERTHYAAELFKQGRAPRIILTNDNLKSGWSKEEERNPLFVERALDELRSQGVASEHVDIVPGRVTNTYDEAMQIRNYSGQHGLRSILIVTSGYQSRRARWTFNRVFRDSNILIGLDPVAPGWEAPRPTTWWSHRLGWQMVPGEYLKMIYYWLHYR